MDAPVPTVCLAARDRINRRTMPSAIQSAPPRASVEPSTDVSVPLTVTLDPELGLTELSKLKQQLLECLDATGTVTLSAAAVKRIGTPALQVLAAFAVDCK